MENCLTFRRKNCKEPIPTSDLNSVVSLCALFDALATEDNGVSTGYLEAMFIDFGNASYTLAFMQFGFKLGMNSRGRKVFSCFTVCCVYSTTIFV